MVEERRQGSLAGGGESDVAPLTSPRTLSPLRAPARFAFLCGVAIGVFGVAMLAVWISDAAALARLRLLVYAMKANTALGFVLIGVALSIGARGSAAPS